MIEELWRHLSYVCSKHPELVHELRLPLYLLGAVSSGVQRIGQSIKRWIIMVQIYV